MACIDTKNWYKNYLDIPFKHLGDTKEGIDCYNLVRLVLKEQLGAENIKPSSSFCNIIDEDWYLKSNKNVFEAEIRRLQHENVVKRVEIPVKFDIILLSIGSTNITNHCAIYAGDNKMLHTMIDRPSYISPYGSLMKQYTTGIYRWINTKI